MLQQLSLYWKTGTKDFGILSALIGEAKPASSILNAAKCTAACAVFL